MRNIVFDFDGTLVDTAPLIIQTMQAGTMTCAVTYGNSTLEALQAVAPDFIIDSFPKLMEVERKLSPR